MNNSGIGKTTAQFAAKLAGHRRAVAIGMLAALVAATAAGAAPASFTPWSDHQGPALSGETTGAANEPPTPGSTTTESAASSGETSTVPTPTSTEGSGHEPSTTLETQGPSPSSTEPAHSEPTHTVAPPTEPSTTLATNTEPATTLPIPLEPSPSTTEVKTLATLQLSCVIVGEHLNNVACTWSGAVPSAFSRYLLLRGNAAEKGRVPFSSGDSSAHSFLDLSVPVGSYTYVIVVIDAGGKSIAHSSLIPITIFAAS